VCRGYLNALSQAGVILFMFVVGLQLDTDLLHSHRRAAVITSHASITTPLLLGSALAIPLYAELAGQGIGFAHFALFLGAAMSVTAFPVLARILADQKLLETRLGTIAITCAAVDDASAWCILAAVAGLVRTTSVSHSFWLTVAGAVIFVGLALTLGRRIASRLVIAYQEHGRLTGGMMSAIILAALAGAWTTEWLGLHALFGAFVVGFIIPRDQALLRELLGRFEEILIVLLLPLFFCANRTAHAHWPHQRRARLACVRGNHSCGDCRQTGRVGDRLAPEWFVVA
jgi:Kef-type K+ transport system membrane component KefB